MGRGLRWFLRLRRIRLPPKIRNTARNTARIRAVARKRNGRIAVTYAKRNGCNPSGIWHILGYRSTLPPEGPTEQALAPLRASEGRRTCPLSGPRRGGCSRAGQRGAPGRTAPRSPRSAPSQPGAPASYVSRPRPDVGRYRRPDAARRGPTPTRPRRARCADPVRPSRPLASACRVGQPPSTGDSAAQHYRLQLYNTATAHEAGEFCPVFPYGYLMPILLESEK